VHPKVDQGEANQAHDLTFSVIKDVVVGRSLTIFALVLVAPFTFLSKRGCTDCRRSTCWRVRTAGSRLVAYKTASSNWQNNCTRSAGITRIGLFICLDALLRWMAFRQLLGSIRLFFLIHVLK
jgi:hypothetical protein